MRSCAAVTLVLMLLLFGIRGWRRPRGGQAQPEPLAAEEQRADADIALTVWDGQELRQMTMAEYLPGVVRGEMPAAFSQQALDAQAVAERTFICYHMAGGRKDAHPEADVCTSPGLLQRLRIAGGRSGPVGGQGGGVRDQGAAGSAGYRRADHPL